VEQAWHQGIVVVTAAGNEGFGSPRLNNPAADPFVIAVGSSDHVGTQRTLDDAISDFSSRGVAERRPDVVAPGRSVVSLRNPGSFIDTMFPTARVGSKYFRGTGTSQSAAVVSGAAALLLQQRPDLRPDQVKILLMATAQRIRRADPLVSGEGLIKVDRALSIPTWVVKDYVQTHAPSTGTGSLEAARGSVHVADPETGEELRGEYDWFGRSWTGGSWSGGSWSGGSWSGGSWSGGSWSGGSWSGGSWSGGSWSGGTWS
jgi:serine protease AprX